MTEDPNSSIASTARFTLSPGTVSDSAVTPSRLNRSTSRKYASATNDGVPGVPGSPLKVMSSDAKSRSAVSHRRRRSSRPATRPASASITAVLVKLARASAAANGHQPSAYSTTRRRAATVFPPTQIGGRFAGRGWAVIPAASKCLPENVTSSRSTLGRSVRVPRRPIRRVARNLFPTLRTHL